MTPIALFLLFASGGPAFVAPTPLEFASALTAFTGRPVALTDIRRVSCKSFGADEPTEAKCSWQQRTGRSWKRYSTYLAVDAQGWHLIDEPYPKP